MTPAPHAVESALGMTLAQFAAARRMQPQAARDDYARRMRSGDGLSLPRITRRQDDDGVVKFCLPVADPDGRPLETESVIIPMRNFHGASWHTLCVSSQVGCRMGCTFCETARMGLVRNLTADEIVQQRVAAGTLMPRPDGNDGSRYRYFADGIRNVVFMGMGEPLDNFDNVVQAIRVLNESAGLNIPLSQITVSTVGRIDGLRRLATLGWSNLRVAISLNAPNDELRNRLMPINKGMPLADLQRALLEYPLARRGLLLIEYVLIKGVNDEIEHADQVASWCQPLRCVVNLIPYNPQRDAVYETSPEDRVLAFYRRLRANGIFVKRRLTRGRALMGACGQLGNPALARVGGSDSLAAPTLLNPR